MNVTNRFKSVKIRSTCEAAALAAGCRGHGARAKSMCPLVLLLLLPLVTCDSPLNNTADEEFDETAEGLTTTLTVVPQKVPADGHSTATITVTVRNSAGKPLQNYPVQLTVSGSHNTLTPTSGKTNASGVFSATLASTEAETKTITAVVPGANPVRATVTFIPPPCTGTLLLPNAPLAGPTGSVPQSVTTGDFNRDGKTDLAVANAGSDNVSVLLGNGDGTFHAAVNYDAGTSPSSVTTGDFNGDGKTDLAVANAASNTVSVLLGNGDGTFQAAVNYNVGSDPASVTTGDVNGS